MLLNFTTKVTPKTYPQALIKTEPKTLLKNSSTTVHDSFLTEKKLQLVSKKLRQLYET